MSIFYLSGFGNVSCLCIPQKFNLFLFGADCPNAALGKDKRAHSGNTDREKGVRPEWSTETVFTVPLNSAPAVGFSLTDWFHRYSTSPWNWHVQYNVFCQSIYKRQRKHMIYQHMPTVWKTPLIFLPKRLYCWGGNWGTRDIVTGSNTQSDEQSFEPRFLRVQSQVSNSVCYRSVLAAFYGCDTHMTKRNLERKWLSTNTFPVTVYHQGESGQEFKAEA